MLKEKQTRNDEKAKLYKYFVQTRLEDQLKNDEDKQLKAMHERMRQDVQREEQDRAARSLVCLIGSLQVV